MSAPKTIIEVNHVSKAFWRHAGQKLLRQMVSDLFKRREEDYFYALRDVSLTVDKGEGVALIGTNGAGKSTMLSLVAGLVQPTEGTVKIEGRVAALLELGSGFHPDLTGEENVFVNAALLGLSYAETKAAYKDIVEFAEIGDFISEPTRTYSSGMMVRLAFSVAVHVRPSILIVDEVLAVGDAQFQAKCLQKVSELRKNKTTLLCVSHSPQMVMNFCDRAVWLHKGQLILDGDSASVMHAYAQYNSNPSKGLPATTKARSVVTV
jgi:ABC-type polysaccharide/polyol phosphate transport system ATPase subunit